MESIELLPSNSLCLFRELLLDFDLGLEVTREWLFLNSFDDKYRFCLESDIEAVLELSEAETSCIKVTNRLLMW